MAVLPSGDAAAAARDSMGRLVEMSTYSPARCAPARALAGDRRSGTDSLGHVVHQRVEDAIELGHLRFAQRRLELLLQGLANRDDGIVQALAARRDADEG